MRSKAEDEAIERAMEFLVHSFESSGDNPKPVILHSTRVGMDLYDRGYEQHVVIAGFLHDLLEDTDATAEEIRSARTSRGSWKPQASTSASTTT